EAHSQPVPPHALIRFDAQPVFSRLLDPGPTCAADLDFQVQGLFSQSGQTTPAPADVANPGGTWSLYAFYSLEVHAPKTRVPPAAAPASSAAGASPGPAAPGTLEVTCTIRGEVALGLTITQPGDDPRGASQTVTIGREHLVSHGEISGTVSAADPSNGQAID